MIWYFIEKDSDLHFNLKIKEETIYLNDDLTIEKVEKHIKTLKPNTKKEDQDVEDALKGLTFNVHLSSDDLEAKKNLVLPYEIIG